MKTRILSFILALVMVLSCMSMSILATDTPDAQAASEGYTPPVTQIPCKDAASILGDKLIYADDFDSGKVGSAEYLYNFTAKDGAAYCNGTSSILKSPGHKAGESYVISFDMMHNGSTQYYPFYTIVNAATSNKAKDFWPVTIRTDGGLWYYPNITGPYETDVTLEANKFYKFDFVHHVAANTFDIYIDGDLVVGNVQATGNNNFVFKQTAIHVTAIDNFKMYYSDKNLECAHSLVGNTCEWCGNVFDDAPHTHTPVALPEDGMIHCTKAEEVLGDKLVVAADFDTVTKDDITDILSGSVENATGEDGNRYIRMKNNIKLTNLGATSASSYVVSFDFLYSDPAGKTVYPLYTISSSTSAEAMWPFSINSTSGELSKNEVYHNGTKWSHKATNTGIFLEKNVFYRMDFVHVTETNTFYLYLDGELVAEGVASSTSNFTVKEILLDTTGAGYIDNLIMYYSDEKLECKHRFTDTYTCDWCGKAFDVEFEDCAICNGAPISANAAVVSKSASLGEMIDMNVYMSLGSELINTPDSKVVLTCGNRSAEYAIADAVKDENGLYKFSIELRSTQMASDVEVKVVGETSDTYKTSIKAYAEELIEANVSEKATALAKAMLNFGTAAQKYFAVKNNDAALDDVLANAGLSADDQNVDAEIMNKAGLNALTYAPNDSDPLDGVQFTAATIMFSAKTHVKVYFTASENATVTVGGRQVTPIASENEGEYYVTFTVENPAEAMTRVSIVVNDGAASVGQDFSAGLLVKVGVDANANAELTALLLAYANYAYCASNYAI